MLRDSELYETRFLESYRVGEMTNQNKGRDHQREDENIKINDEINEIDNKNVKRKLLDMINIDLLDVTYCKQERVRIKQTQINIE